MSALLLAAVVGFPSLSAATPAPAPIVGPHAPAPPAITQQPKPVSSTLWSTVQLNVVASGTGLTYQWFHNGQPVQNGAEYIGAQSATLTMLAASPATRGNYEVRVTSPGGTLASNNVPVELGCYADCNLDGVLNIADFGCYQTKFALGDPWADCNSCGLLNLGDFGCFQTRFALGC